MITWQEAHLHTCLSYAEEVCAGLLQSGSGQGEGSKGRRQLMGEPPAVSAVGDGRILSGHLVCLTLATTFHLSPLVRQ